MAAIAIFAMGSTAFGMEAQAGWNHGGCHRYTVSSVGLGYRHNLIGLDSDWDLSCYDVEWHYGQHHYMDEDRYCLKHDCAYEDCWHGQGNEYWGGCWQDGGGQATAGSVSGTDTDTGNAAVANGNSVSGGSQDYGSGNRGGGHHGNGHHGGRHH